MTPGQKRALWLAFGGGLALLILTFVRELRTFGALGSDPLTVGAGFRLYRLQWASGRVTGYRKWTETVKGTTTYEDRYGSRTDYFTRTHVNEAFTLVGSGGEHPVHVVNAHVEIPEGHLATAVWATRRRRSVGDYVLFFDRTDSRVRPINYGIGQMLTVNLWILLPVLAAAWLIGGGTLPLLFRESAASMRTFFPILPGLVAAFVVWIVAMLWINRVVIPRRPRRFTRKDAPRILSAIEKAEC